MEEFHAGNDLEGGGPANSGRTLHRRGGQLQVHFGLWARGLVIKLLEVTLGMGRWLYRNVHVHNAVSGAITTRRKDELMEEIEEQIELGGGLG